MREEVMRVLATALSENIGNRLTAALATGIATTVNQAILTMESEQKTAGENSEQ